MLLIYQVSIPTQVVFIKTTKGHAFLKHAPNICNFYIVLIIIGSVIIRLTHRHPLPIQHPLSI